MHLFSKLRRITARSSALVIRVASSASGGFTLPVAAEWNRRTLPAGDYKFVVSPASPRIWVYVRGDDETAVFHVASIERAAGAPCGVLCLLYDDSGYRVRSLKLPDTGETLYFGSRRPVPAPREASGWSGVLYVSLRPGVPVIGPGYPIPQHPS